MKKLIVILGAIIAIVVIVMVSLRIYTKQFSPVKTSTFSSDSVTINIKYSAPYKNDRVIFGELVPYDKVWRTGANEVTTFTTTTDLKIKNKTLEAGSYSLFTIPHEGNWEIIFNKETGQWGIEMFSGEANRSPEEDALTISANAIKTKDIFEQFTINFEEMGEEIEMVMMWEQTLVVVPMVVE